MKRGFFFGLGSFFIIAAIGSIGRFLFGTFSPISVLIALGCIALSAIVIRVAMNAPSHKSRLHAFVGWCLGFFIFDAAIFAAIGVAILVPALLK